MKTIIRHIEYLASRKDCVIIPGLGAILARHESARLDLATNLFFPPGRAFTFNASLCADDDALISSVACGEGISVSAAASVVSDEVEALKQELSSGKEIRLGCLGSLRYDGSLGGLAFRSSVSKYLCPSAMWLRPIDVAPTIPAAETIFIDAPVIKRPHNLFRRLTRMAASIALLIGICFVASTPLSIDDAAMASLVPEITPLAIEDLAPARADTLAPVVKTPTASAPIPLTPVAADTVNAASPLSGRKYNVIVATLSKSSDAEMFINQHPGLSLTSEKSGKYYKVSAGSYASRDEAVEACRSIRRQFADAWVQKDK